MRVYDVDSEDFARQTVVMMYLPEAVHPRYEDWRSKADALIDSLREEGWQIIRATPPPPGAVTEGGAP